MPLLDLMGPLLVVFDAGVLRLGWWPDSLAFLCNSFSSFSCCAAAAFWLGARSRLGREADDRVDGPLSPAPGIVAKYRRRELMGCDV